MQTRLALRKTHTSRCKEKKVMPIKNVLHMNTGDGESSYANNSSLQETAIRKARRVLNETIKSIANLDGFPQCFNVADLGCSSGPNTLLVVSIIIDEVHEVCKESNHKVPQFQVCLNDLFENDFNTIFKSLPMFYAKLKKEKGENFGPCFISAVPGSFYGRLFPDENMHLVHSSYSIHWLSQVPEGLENNKQNIYMAKTSPPNVFEAYGKQFQKDFMMFLQSRSQEIIHGGHMVLTTTGRSIADPTSKDGCRLWELLANSLVDVVKEGLVPESKLNSFNMPCYSPYIDEVKDAIEKDGSFSLDSFEFFEVNWDPHDKDHPDMIPFDAPSHGKTTSKIIRAVVEPMLTTHFGNSIMDLLFKKFEKYVDEDLAIEKTRHFNIVISMTKI